MPESPLQEREVVLNRTNLALRARAAVPGTGSRPARRWTWWRALAMTLEPLAAVRAGGAHRTGSDIPAIAGGGRWRGSFRATFRLCGVLDVHRQLRRFSLSRGSGTGALNNGRRALRCGRPISKMKSRPGVVFLRTWDVRVVRPTFHVSWPLSRAKPVMDMCM